MTTAVTSTPADVLRQAADWLAENPARWTQGEFIGPDNCRCALGAVALVLAPLDLEGNPTALVNPETNDLGTYTADFLANYLADQFGAPIADGASSADNIVETVANWNDAAGRTPADVIAALRGAADEFDARQAARTARAS